MVKALFDTNILIDYLNGIKAAQTEMARYNEKAISIITWMEVMVGTTAATAESTRLFLTQFDVYPLTDAVAEKVLEIRKKKRIKLPDVIVLATALTEKCLLITRNIKDFPKDEPGIRMPYKI
jgi:predicted nucleic acid-binding protein